MPGRSAVVEETLPNSLKFSRCGPSPTVCTTSPIAPASTRRNASCIAGLPSRSPNTTSQRAPDARTSSSCARVVTPGLSDTIDFPARAASTTIAARSPGIAAVTTMVMSSS
jgi:hypothetical protein